MRFLKDIGTAWKKTDEPFTHKEILQLIAFGVIIGVVGGITYQILK